jgi:ABC-type uncharacterized transport system, ATPase component
MDSLRINAAVYEIPEKEFRERVGELAELLDLESKLKQPVRKLSLGERMKAELLAALLHRPQILFLDEPGTELEFVIMVIAVSCVKLLSAHNSTQHTSRKHKV